MANKKSGKNILRKCVGCGQIIDRSLLIKITLNAQKLRINPDSKTLGRSVYVCKNSDCVKNLIKKKKLFSTLKYKNFEEVQRIEKELVLVLNTSVL